MVMDKVVKKAAERKVAVGAHPGYPDLMGFGRRKMVLKPSEVKNYIKYQVGALMAFTASYGMSFSMWLPTVRWEICASMTGTYPGPYAKQYMR